MSKPLILHTVLVAVLLWSGGVFAQADPADGDAPAEAPAVEEAAPAAVAPVAEPSAAPIADATYELQLRELEDRINELKEDVFRSKSRLYLLREQILRDNIGGSRAIVRHVDRLGNLFRIERVIYSMDGNQLFSATAETNDELGGGGRIDVFDGSVLPGPHNIAVQVELVGNDFGLFSYMSGYRFSLTEAFAVIVDEGKTVEIDVELFDHGGSRRALEERPDIRFQSRTYDTTEETVSEEDADAENGDAG